MSIPPLVQVRWQAHGGGMELLVILTVVTALYAYGYWRLFRDEGPRYAPGSHRNLVDSASEEWERLTAGWARGKPM